MRLNTRVADSLNVMYQDVVNKHLVAPIKTREYAEAYEFIEKSHKITLFFESDNIEAHIFKTSRKLSVIS